MYTTNILRKFSRIAVWRLFKIGQCASIFGYFLRAHSTVWTRKPSEAASSRMGFLPQIALANTS
jgi:hypothetical protein